REMGGAGGGGKDGVGVGVGGEVAGNRTVAYRQGPSRAVRDTAAKQESGVAGDKAAADRCGPEIGDAAASETFGVAGDNATREPQRAPNEDAAFIPIGDRQSG